MENIFDNNKDYKPSDDYQEQEVEYKMKAEIGYLNHLFEWKRQSDIENKHSEGVLKTKRYPLMYMYILVNSDVNMSSRMITGRVGHLVGLIVKEITQKYYRCGRINADFNAYENYAKWDKSGRKKIILKASQEEIKPFLVYNDCICIRDTGKKLPLNTITVIGFYPTVEEKDKFNHLTLI